MEGTTGFEINNDDGYDKEYLASRIHGSSKRNVLISK